MHGLQKPNHSLNNPLNIILLRDINTKVWIVKTSHSFIQKGLKQMSHTPQLHPYSNVSKRYFRCYMPLCAVAIDPAAVIKGDVVKKGAFCSCFFVHLMCTIYSYAWNPAVFQHISVTNLLTHKNNYALLKYSIQQDWRTHTFLGKNYAGQSTRKAY